MREHLKILVLLMVGGSLGTICRYALSLLAARVFGTGFAWGTLIVNSVGCFLIGFSFELADRTNLMGPLPRLFFVTGFLGALTTFSTYAVESVNFFVAEATLLALANFAANNVLGLALVILGMWVGRHL